MSDIAPTPDHLETPSPPVRFTARFSTGELPAIPHRFRLVWAASRPLAQRAVIVRNLLGLDRVISLAEVDPVRGPLGWEFSLDADHTDAVLGIRYLSEAFRAAAPDVEGPSTVPALVDETTGAVVSDDMVHLATEFMTAWEPFHGPTAPNLYPEELRPHIDAMNKVLIDDLFGGVDVIRAATSQAEYDDGFSRVFKRLDDLEEMLSSSRYLFGHEITDPDIILYTWLVRFDVAYYATQGVNRHRLGEFANLWEYARDLYQTPEFGSTTDFGKIKRAYALASRRSNPHGIVPGGPDVTGWQAPAQRLALIPAHVER